MELYYPGKVETVFRTVRRSLGYFTFDMINGSPCSSPPFSVKPQGAPPCNSAWTSTNVPLWITELLPPGTLLSIARMWESCCSVNGKKKRNTGTRMFLLDQISARQNLKHGMDHFLASFGIAAKKLRSVSNSEHLLVHPTCRTEEIATFQL